MIVVGGFGVRQIDAPVSEHGINGALVTVCGTQVIVPSRYARCHRDGSATGAAVRAGPKIRATGAHLLFPLSCSPGLNPIEQAVAELNPPRRTASRRMADAA